jgi:LysM domain
VAAVAYPMVDPWSATHSVRPARLGWPEGLDWPGRLDRSGRLGARVYRRRRAVALLALVAVAVMAMAAVRLALAGPGGGALTTSRSSGAATAPAAGKVYVVQPGDSLWSIVQATAPAGDPRPAVDRLARQLDGRPLFPGQRIVVP